MLYPLYPLYLVVVLAVLILVSGDCTKEEFRKKFGVEPLYAMHGSGDGPGIEDGHFIAEVSYQSMCLNGDSIFKADFHTREETGMIVLFISREKEQCIEAERVEKHMFKGHIAVKVDDDAKFESFREQTSPLVAFPPDGDYEIYLLKTRHSTNAGRNAIQALKTKTCQQKNN